MSKRRSEPKRSALEVAVTRHVVEKRRARSWSTSRVGGLLLLVAAIAFVITRSTTGVPLFATSGDLRGFVALLGNAPKSVSGALAFSLDGSKASPSPDDESDIDAEATDEGQAAPAGHALKRDGHVGIPGGILVLPSSFEPDADGAYDLLIHFHGNTAVVKESAEVAHLNAAVAMVNLGVGSLPYEEFYAVPGTYEDLLASVNRGLESRGVVGAHLRRVALSGWSAGYGSISTILQVRKKTDDLDAVLIFDGIHCGWEGGALNARQMKPFVDIAEKAARGEMFFGITHSAIDPRLYASTTATSSYLLDAVGAKRETRDPERDQPRYLELESMNGAISKKLVKHMEPTSEARKGTFHVIGYRGETPEHHMEHLFQMGSTLLPELVQRWSQHR